MQAEVSEKLLLSSNAYLLMLLNETLDIQTLNYLNTDKDGYYNVEATESTTKNVDVEIDCPFGEGFFRISCSVIVTVIEASFKGDYYNPPDSDEVDVDIEVDGVYFYDSEGEEYEIDIKDFNRRKELITKAESMIVCS